MGSHRDPITSEKGWLDFAVRELSRVAAGKARGQEAVWRSQCKPSWWDCACSHPWKNPTANPKDSKDTLKHKFECLVQHLRKKGQLPCEMEEEIALWEGGRMSEVFLMTTFSSLLGQASNLHSVLGDLCHKMEDTGISIAPSIPTDLQRCLSACLDKIDTVRSLATQRNTNSAGTGVAQAAGCSGHKRQHGESDSENHYQPPSKRPKFSSTVSPISSSSTSSSSTTPSESSGFVQVIPFSHAPPNSEQQKLAFNSSSLSSNLSSSSASSATPSQAPSPSPVQSVSNSDASLNPEQQKLAFHSSSLSSNLSSSSASSPSQASSPSPVQSVSNSDASLNPEQQKLVLATLHKQLLLRKVAEKPAAALPVVQPSCKMTPSKHRAVPSTAQPKHLAPKEPVHVLNMGSVAAAAAAVNAMPQVPVPTTASEESVPEMVDGNLDFMGLCLDFNADDSDFFDDLLKEKSPNVSVNSPASESDGPVSTFSTQALSELMLEFEQSQDENETTNHVSLDPFLCHTMTATKVAQTSPLQFGTPVEAVAGRLLGPGAVAISDNSGITLCTDAGDETAIASDLGYSSEGSSPTSHRSSLDSDAHNHADMGSPDLDALLGLF